MTRPPFQNEKYYHICNRGVDKRKVFLGDDYYVRFLYCLKYFNDTRPTGGLGNYIKTFQRSNDLWKVQRGQGALVDILCYCLNKNHYHLLLRQKQENGIPKFMQKIGNSYTQYFNKKNRRSGALFQGNYKAFEIKSDSKLWEASFYINGNAEIHGIAKCGKWPWSSCLDYLGERRGDLCHKNMILKDFENIKEYRGLLFEYVREKEVWKQEMKNFE